MLSRNFIDSGLRLLIGVWLLILTTIAIGDPATTTDQTLPGMGTTPPIMVPGSPTATPPPPRPDTPPGNTNNPPPPRPGEPVEGVTPPPSGTETAPVPPATGTTANPPPRPDGQQPNATAGAMTTAQTLSDEGQRNTIAFSGLSFLTGSLGADSFFPPGKVADFWGFQYMRDNDPSQKGHNTDFLTKAADNMLSILNDSQRAQLIALAQSQVTSINEYAYKRFPLMKAFRRLLEGDLPVGTTGLDESAVKAYSAELYHLDGEISLQRATVMGGILASLDTSQRAYLDALKGKGMLDWPDVGEQLDKTTLDHDVHVAVMTYAGDLFSWYLGSVEADVYFAPERQGTYFGSFYMKDAPAMGNPDYTISSTLTGDTGQNFLNLLTADQALLLTGLVDSQRPILKSIVETRQAVSTQLRRYITGETVDSATILSLMEQYGELDGAIIYQYATHFAQVGQSLTDAQWTQLMNMRVTIMGDFSSPPAGAYLYSNAIAMPEIPNTDFLFGVTASTDTSTTIPDSTTTCSATNLSACTTEATCIGVGGMFSNNICIATLDNTCDTQNLNSCATEVACSDAGGIFVNNTTCTAAPPVLKHPDKGTAAAISNTAEQTFNLPTQFSAGVSVNGSPFMPTATVKANDRVEWAVNLAVNPIHVNQLAQLLLVIGIELPTTGGDAEYTGGTNTVYHALDAGFNRFPVNLYASEIEWPVELAKMTANPFKANVTLKQKMSLNLRKGTLAALVGDKSRAKVYTFAGYALTDGTIVYNGMPIITTLEDNATTSAFTLTSPAVANGQLLSEYQCEPKINGIEESIPLAWSNVPKGTGSLAVTMHHYPDPNDTSHLNSYLLLWNIAPTVTAIAHGAADDGLWYMGANKDGVAVSYTSPCSPNAGSHEYTLTLYALSQTPASLPLQNSVAVTYDILMQAISTVEVLDTATLTFSSVTQ